MSEFRFPDPAEREKRGHLSEMLDVGKVMIYVNPRRDGVDLPPHLRAQIAVPLNLSRRFQLETFDVGPLAVKASLSFGGERYLCVLPYRAIFGLYSHEDGRRLVFADAVPPEVAIVEPSTHPEEPEPPAQSEVSLDSTEGSEARADESAPASEGPAQIGRPTLRLVDE